MSVQLTRRDFVLTGAAAGLAAVQASPATAHGPHILVRRAIPPVVISSANGNQFKNGGTQTCVEKAFQMIVKDSDVLDALIAGVNIVELDPEDTSVGYGGIPNADGIVQLDASCMHGPKRRAGAVAALEGVRTPSLVAKAVMDNTDHVLLVGRDARTFARNMSFKIEADLNTERSRKAWLEWKRRTDPSHFPSPRQLKAARWQAVLDMAAEGWLDPEHIFGTINCNGINAKGEICGVTSTSGLDFKIPGRVGDSPILGAGLYVDTDIGAAGSTGRGEANLFNLSSFLVVENLRRGMHPKDAGLDACKRIKANTVEKRLLNRKGNPNFNVNFYIINAKGEYAGVCLYPGARYSVCTENGPQTLQSEPLLER